MLSITHEGVTYTGKQYLGTGCLSEAWRMDDGRVLIKTLKSDPCKLALAKLSGQSKHLPVTTFLGEHDGYNYFLQPYYHRVGSWDSSQWSSDIAVFMRNSFGYDRPCVCEVVDMPIRGLLGVDKSVVEAILLVAMEVVETEPQRTIDLHFMNIGFDDDGTVILLDPIS